MEKKFKFSVSFEGKKYTFCCAYKDFISKISSHFNVQPNDIEFFMKNEQGKFDKVFAGEIKHFKELKIERKPNYRKLCYQSLVKQPKPETIVESINRKLKENNTLSGKERKYLLDCLESGNGHSTKMAKKTATSLSSKEVQTCFAPVNSVSCQTDSSFTMPMRSTEPEQDIVKKMKIIATVYPKSTSKYEVSKLMSETFDERRNFIVNELPLICVVKEKYPLLFSLDQVKEELDRIFYTGKCQEFIKNIEKYSAAILDEAVTHPIYLRTQKCIKRAITEKQRSYARDVGSLLILPCLLKEDFSFLNLLDHHSETEAYPCIDSSTNSIKELFFDDLLYKVTAEGKLICEATDLKEAILCLVACFFIFNIRYTERNFQTFVAFEKLYLESDETVEVDSSTRKKINHLKLKVL